MPMYYYMKETVKHPYTREVVLQEGLLYEASTLERADLEIGADCFNCAVILAPSYADAVCKADAYFN